MPYRRTEKVLARQADRRLAIIKAAIEIADRDGLDALQVDDVATRARVAVGTIYLYFADRSELTAALVAHLLERDAAAIGRAADAGPRGVPAAAAAIAVYVHRIGATRRLLPTLTTAPAYRCGIVREFERIIGDAVDMGQIPSSDPAMLAAAVYGALNGVLLAGALLPVGKKNEPALILLALRTIGLQEGEARARAGAAWITVDGGISSPARESTK